MVGGFLIECCTELSADIFADGWLGEDLRKSGAVGQVSSRAMRVLLFQQLVLHEHVVWIWK